VNEGLIRAKYTKSSVCECGFPVLATDVPIGQIYLADTRNKGRATLVCGGCGAHKLVECIAVIREDRAGDDPGFLPTAIFEFDEGWV
jgi:hypothetical protein